MHKYAKNYDPSQTTVTMVFVQNFITYRHLSQSEMTAMLLIAELQIYGDTEEKQKEYFLFFNETVRFDPSLESSW